jgi:DNA-binding MarR family transcriptional regulator
LGGAAAADDAGAMSEVAGRGDAATSRIAATASDSVAAALEDDAARAGHAGVTVDAATLHDAEPPVPHASARSRPAAGERVATTADVLKLLRQYRSAEAASRREARRETSLGETDLIAMRLLVEADRTGRVMTPGTLASSLGISTASTTALLDRLESAGFIERRPHESDRRSIVIVPTVRSEQEVHEALGRMQANLARVADDMTQAEIEVVARFLSRMIAVVRDTPPHRR